MATTAASDTGDPHVLVRLKGGHRSRVNCVRFEDYADSNSTSVTGIRVLTGASDKLAIIWQIELGAMNQVTILKRFRHSDAVSECCLWNVSTLAFTVTQNEMEKVLIWGCSGEELLSVVKLEPGIGSIYQTTLRTLPIVVDGGTVISVLHVKTDAEATDQGNGEQNYFLYTKPFDHRDEKHTFTATKEQFTYFTALPTSTSANNIGIDVQATICPFDAAKKIAESMDLVDDIDCDDDNEKVTIKLFHGGTIIVLTDQVRLTGASFSNESRLMCTASCVDATVKVFDLSPQHFWDSARNTEEHWLNSCKFTFDNHSEGINMAILSPRTGTYVISCSDDSTCFLYDLFPCEREALLALFAGYNARICLREPLRSMLAIDGVRKRIRNMLIC